MCLSTVVKVGETPSVLCNNIQSVSVDPADGKLTFIDIMGIRYEALARICKIDLVENKIFIEESNDQ